MKAKLINKEDIWDWCSENNLWYPESNLKLFGEIDLVLPEYLSFTPINIPPTFFYSKREGRKIIKSDNGKLLLSVCLKGFEDNTFYMEFYNNAKKIDIKNITPYNGYLFFEVGE